MIDIKYIPLPNNDVAYKKTSYFMVPQLVCIHNSANKATAQGEIEYMHSTNDYRSFHFAVDDTSIVQGLPLDRNAWHAGDGEYGSGNRASIGIEICLSYVPKKVNGVEVGDETEWQEKAKIDALEDKVEKLSAIIAKYEKQKVYDNAAIRWAYIDGNLPEWAAPTIKKLVKVGYLKGNGEGSLELSKEMMRMLVILDRAGTFGK